MVKILIIHTNAAIKGEQHVASPARKTHDFL